MTGPDHPPPRPVRDDVEDLDPGLARERTRLAWRRTAIAVTAVAIAVLKIDPVAGAPLVVTAGALWAVGPQLERTGPMSRATRPRRRAVRLIALVTLVTALVALGVALSAGGTTRQFHRTAGPAGQQHGGYSEEDGKSPPRPPATDTSTEPSVIYGLLPRLRIVDVGRGVSVG